MDLNSAAKVVAELCAGQHGLVTTGQARQSGVTPQQMKRLVDKGALERVHYGIYRMSRLPDDEHVGLRVAWFALEPATVVVDRYRQELPGGVVSHRSAAAMHGLGDLDADYREFTVKRRTRIKDLDVRLHVGQIGRTEWNLVDGIPTTTAVRTISDLASVHTDGGHLAGVVRDALEKNLATTGQVAEALAPHAFDYGHALNDGVGFLKLLIAEAGVSQNVMELADLARSGRAAPATSSTSNSQHIGRVRGLPDIAQTLGGSLPSTDAVAEALKMVNANNAALSDAIRDIQKTFAGTQQFAELLRTISASLPSTNVIAEAAKVANVNHSAVTNAIQGLQLPGSTIADYAGSAAMNDLLNSPAIRAANEAAISAITPMAATPSSVRPTSARRAGRKTRVPSDSHPDGGK